MITLKKLSLFLCITLISFSCQKNKDFNSVLPENVELNEAVIFLNGDITEDYSTRKVRNREIYSIMSYGFSHLHPEIAGVTSLTFDRCPRSVGRFTLSDDRQSTITDETACYAGLSQTVYEDLDGQEFELQGGEGYLEITELDYENKFASGHFKVKFKRTDNGGSGIDDIKLPKWVTFEGIFSQEFEE